MALFPCTVPKSGESQRELRGLASTFTPTVFAGGARESAATTSSLVEPGSVCRLASPACVMRDEAGAAPSGAFFEAFGLIFPQSWAEVVKPRPPLWFR